MTEDKKQVYRAFKRRQLALAFIFAAVPLAGCVLLSSAVWIIVKLAY